MNSQSDDEREEREDRAERDLRWGPPSVTDLIPPLIPLTIRDGPRIVRERTEILDVYSDTEFRQMFRFHKEPFLRIVDILEADFPTGRGAISPEKRVGLFLSYCSGNETQVKIECNPQIQAEVEIYL